MRPDGVSEVAERCRGGGQLDHVGDLQPIQVLVLESLEEALGNGVGLGRMVARADMGQVRSRADEAQFALPQRCQSPSPLNWFSENGSHHGR